MTDDLENQDYSRIYIQLGLSEQAIEKLKPEEKAAISKFDKAVDKKERSLGRELTPEEENELAGTIEGASEARINYEKFYSELADQVDKTEGYDTK
ncbi:MAG TPA: hypothetical protein VI819_04495 [Patescibacteria group bacterium]|nr:hypothetical protein [Patescibacteria group bacterium]